MLEEITSKIKAKETELEKLLATHNAVFQAASAEIRAAIAVLHSLLPPDAEKAPNDSQ